jgi:hypothetical protein
MSFPWRREWRRAKWHRRHSTHQHHGWINSPFLIGFDTSELPGAFRARASGCTVGRAIAAERLAVGSWIEMKPTVVDEGGLWVQTSSG